MSDKCTFGNIEIKLDGVHLLDPCVYEEIETFPAMVTLLRCKNCGHEETEFRRIVFCEECRFCDGLICELTKTKIGDEDFCSRGERYEA